MRDKYTGWALDYDKTRRLIAMSYYALLVLLYAALPSPLLVAPGNRTVLNFTLFGIVVFAASGVYAYARFSLRKTNRLTGMQITAVMTYKTCVAVDKFLESTLHETKKKQAKVALKALIRDLRLWLGRKTPDFMASPATNLINALRGKAAYAIDKGSLENIKALQFALYLLLRELGSETLTAEQINAITANIENSLPVPAAQEKKSRKLSWFDDKPIAKHGIILGAITVILGILTYYIVFPYSNNDALKAAEFSVILVGVFSTIYIAFLVQLEKRR